MPSRLNQEEIARYHRDGFVFVRELFDSEETDLLRRTMEEDPAIREEFEDTLKREGLQSRMNAEFYERPPAEGEVVMGDVM